MTPKLIMRTVGIGVLGLIGGLLLAIVLQDALAHVLIDTAGTPSVAGIFLGSLLPVFAVVGAAFAVWLDHRLHQTRSQESTDD